MYNVASSICTVFSFTLQSMVYTTKQSFNRAFQDLFAKKEQEIGKIKEKNRRIRKILRDLMLPVDVIDPELTAVEKPELQLNVTDGEVCKEILLR